VRTAPISQQQNRRNIDKIDTLTHNNITSDFPGLVQAFQ